MSFLVNLNLVAVALLCTGICLYILYRKRNSRKRAFFASIKPIFFELPIVGSLFSVISFGDRLGILQIIVKRINQPFARGIAKLNVCGISFITINDGILAHDILSNQEALSRANRFRNAGKGWLAQSVILDNPPKWRQTRKTVQQSFTTKMMPSYIQVFNSHTKKCIDDLKETITAGEFDIAKYIDALALDIVFSTTLGTEVHTQSNCAEVLSTVQKMFEDVAINAANPVDVNLFKFLSNYERTQWNKIMSFFSKIVGKKQQELRLNLKDDSEKSSTFLDIYLPLIENEGKTMEEICGEIMAILMAGFETSAITIEMAIFFMATHPEVQKKVFEEQQQLFADNYQEISLQDILKMEYLNMVLKETLRMHTPVYLTPRRTTGDIPLSNGMVIPAGIDMFINLETVNMDPKVWPNPERFDPDRFLPKAVESRDPRFYVPFSSGFRNCIGYKYATYEVMVILAALIREYEFSTTKTLSDLRMVYTLTKSSSNGYPVSLQRRKLN